MTEQRILELSLATGDHFFHHIERSTRASVLTPRGPTSGQAAWLGTINAPRNVPDTHSDMSLLALNLRAKLLSDCFTDLFDRVWFQRLLGICVIGLSASLIAEEPSTPAAAVVFLLIYIGVTIAVLSRVEYSLLLGELLQRFQTIYIFLWSLFLLSASIYQSLYEYDTAGSGVGLSSSMYATHLTCTFLFNSTSLVVVLLLDAMPTVAYSSKAAALLLFLGNAMMIWIMERFSLSAHQLQPQMWCITSLVSTESCVDTQRMKIAALSSVCIFLMHNCYVNARNAWFLEPNQQPVFALITSKMTLVLLEPDDVVPFEIPVVQLVAQRSFVRQDVPEPETPLSITNDTVAVHQALLHVTINTPRADTLPKTHNPPSSLPVHPTIETEQQTTRMSYQNVPRTGLATPIEIVVSSDAQHDFVSAPIPDPVDGVQGVPGLTNVIVPSSNFLLRTNFLIDYPNAQRYLNPLFGDWLYSAWHYPPAVAAYVLISLMAVLLFLVGEPSSLPMVPVMVVLHLVTIVGGLSSVDRSLLRDLSTQFEYRFLVGSIIVWACVSQFRYIKALYALYIGQTELVVQSANVINTTVWVFYSLTMVSCDSSFAPLAFKRWISALFVVGSCFVLYRNLFVYPQQTVLLVVLGQSVPIPWLESARWCLAGECVSAQSVYIQVWVVLAWAWALYCSLKIPRNDIS